MANLLNLFGFSFKEKEEQKLPSSVVSPDVQDGSVVIDKTGNHYDTVGSNYYLGVDIEGQIKNDQDLIRRYRELAKFPEVAEAIENIVNEAIVIDNESKPVTLNLEELKVTDNIKKKIQDAFEQVLNILNFNDDGYEMFERWYVDGKTHYHVLLEEQTNLGIKEVRYVDPRKIKKIRNIIKGKLPTGVDVVKEIEEYYLYNDKGIDSNTTQGVKLSKDSVIYCSSGLLDSYTNMIQSYLHKAMKPANQLKMLEEAVIIYRYTRAPERRVFYIDVGNLPKGKAEQYVTDMMNKFKNKLTYDAVSGEIVDSKKHLCLDMNTRVPLLDGRTMSISEISEEMKVSNKQLWAYSCDPITGEFAPGKITWAGVSRPNAQVMKITLDNGENITCTPDHKFPVWNKGLVKAEDLIVGESMVPHYTRLKNVTNGSNKDYQQLFANDTGEWEFTHRLVSNWKDSLDLDNEFVFNEEFAKHGLYTVHHININRFDNSPENLVRMNSKDHISWHRSSGSNSGKIGGKNCYEMGKGYHNKSHPDYTEWHKKAGTAAGVVNAESGVSSANRAKGRQILAELLLDEDWKNWFVDQLVNGWTDDKRTEAGIRAKSTGLSAKGNAYLKEQYKDENSKLSVEHKKKYSTEYPSSLFDKIKELAKQGCTVADVVATLNSDENLTAEFAEINSMKVMGKQKNYTKFNKADVGRIVNLNGFNGYSHLRDSLVFRNHKIAKIEWLDERMDTGCLTIDGNEEFHNHHTFALAAGIYTQNSMMEDFWMPRRGDKSTEITTLPGGQGLGNLDDLDYFKNKLYQSLNVPKSRFVSDTAFSIGKTDTVSRDEIKFNRFVVKLRNKFSAIFLDLLKIQLVSQRVMNASDWEKIKGDIVIDYNRDNYFSELKETEILNSRLAAVQMVDPFVGKYISKAYVQKKILRLTEDEIKEENKQLEVEAPVQEDPQGTPDTQDDQTDATPPPSSEGQ